MSLSSVVQEGRSSLLPFSSLSSLNSLLGFLVSDFVLFFFFLFGYPVKSGLVG